MSRGRYNRAPVPLRNPHVTPEGAPSKAKVAATLKAFKDAHWGIEADQVLVVHDKDLPNGLAMMGRLVELVVRSPSGEEIALTFDTDGQIPPAALCFDKPGGRRPERLYNVLVPAVEERMRRQLWSKGRGVAPVPLSTLARFDEDGDPTLSDTRQLRRGGFAKVSVKPVGIVVSVTYRTAKLDDAEPRRPNARAAADFHPDDYEHECGEESGIRPWLGVDERGRLWWAGGNYHVPVAGITD